MLLRMASNGLILADSNMTARVLVTVTDPSLSANVVRESHSREQQKPHVELGTEPPQRWATEVPYIVEWSVEAWARRKETKERHL